MDDMTLNRRIAEALGWRQLVQTQGWYETPESDGFEDCWVGFPPEGHSERYAPNWSQDLGAAMALCVEIARGHNYELTVCPYPGFVVAGFDNARTDEPLMHVTGDTPARALALLALRALGGEDAPERGGDDHV